MAHLTPSPMLPLPSFREVSEDLALRIRVHWRSRELDLELARGANPDTSDELTMRAQQLANSEHRRELARSIRDLLRIAEAEYGAAVPFPRAPIARWRIGQSRQELLELSDRLLADPPHSARGLALATLLLEDPHSPLYGHQLSGRALPPAITEVLDALAEPENGLS